MPKYRVMNRPYEGHQTGETFTAKKTEAVRRAVERGSIVEVHEQKISQQPPSKDAD